MDRATKLTVAGVTCGCVALKVLLLRSQWPAVPWLAGGLFVLFAILASIDRRAVRGVLVLLYIYPALISFVRGFYHSDYDVLWMSGLLGVMAPSVFRTPWHLPSRWRIPLVLWAA